MAEHDSFPELYALTGEMPLRVHLEIFTFLTMIGDIGGKRVLDAACGHGLYSRLLKQRGAASVTGIDLSEPLLRIARDIEQKAPLGIDYVHGDVLDPGPPGAFDLVSAVWLFPMAETPAQLAAMAKSLHGKLAPGGMLAGITGSTALAADHALYRPYGLTVHAPAAPGDGDTYTVDIHSDPSFSFSARFWTMPTVEHALAEAGFHSVTWTPAQVSAEGQAQLGAEHWVTMLRFPIQRFFTARK